MRTVHTVKKILSVILCAALLICACPIAFAETKTPEKLTLVTLSDLHYFPDSLKGNRGEAYYNYMCGSNASPDDMNAIVDAAFESLKYASENEGLKYVVICGDLTVNGEYAGNVELAEKLKALAEETGLNIFVTNGNHDINNSLASHFLNDRKNIAKRTSAADFCEIYNDFGYGSAYRTYKELGCGTQGCLTYSVKLEEGYRLIFADGGKYSADSTENMIEEHETAGAFTDEQLEWILAEIEDAEKNGEIPLMFTHWNISGMNWFHEKLLQGFAIDDCYKLPDILADAGCHYVFSGHQHQSDINITYSDSGEALYSVITPTLTEFPFCYRSTVFTPGTDGSIEAQFDQCECDEHSAVKSVSGADYPTPYRLTGFGKQFGGNADAADYLMYMCKGLLGNIIGDIRAEGSIVSYIEKKADFDIEQWFNDLLGGGIRFNSTEILTGANLMSFLDDIDVQLMEKYIYDLPHTYEVLEKALDNLAAVKVSDVPCDKYIETYGFGSETEGGTIGDLLLDVMATMYPGNEDISDDAFMQDVLKKCGETEFVDLIFDAAKKYVAEDVVVDEILANTDLHLNSMFTEHAASISTHVQLAYNILLALLGSGVFTAKSVSDFGNAIINFFVDGSNVSLKKLADVVLGTGFISYGSTVDELFDSLLDKFFGMEQKKAAAYQLYVLFDGIANDETDDFDVTYTYAGAEPVVPTKESMRLPSNVQLSLTDDTCTSFTVTWFTRWSVEGTDIEVVKAGESFTGKLTTENTEAETENETFSGYGFDFGTFGILPWTEDVIKHTVTVSGLEPDTEYAFRFGDAEKDFMCEGSYKTSPEDGSEFTFINVTDSDGTCPADYTNGLAAALNAAKATFDDIAFAVHSGNFVKNPANDLEWTWALDSSADALSSMPLMYTAGTDDANEDYTAVKHFTLPYGGNQFTENGVYYSFDYADTHFIVLNTNYTEDGTIEAVQLKWLEDDLKNNDSKWTVLSLYAPVTGEQGENSVVKGQLLSLMKTYKIDLILQGGGKAYVRTALLRDDERVDDFDIEIVTLSGKMYTVAHESGVNVTAISGCTAPYYASSAPEDAYDRYVVSETVDRPVFTAVTVKDNCLVFGAYAVNEDGTAERIDEFGILKTTYHVVIGDTDLNGTIEPADARLALRMSVGLETPNDLQMIAADIDGTGNITESDARMILRASVGLEEFEPEAVDIPEYQLHR